MVAQGYLVPFAPRSLDIWTLRKVENLVANALQSGLCSLTFINKADARGTHKEEVAELLRGSEYLQFLDAPVGNRISLTNAAASGRIMLEIKPSDDKE